MPQVGEQARQAARAAVAPVRRARGPSARHEGGGLVVASILRPEGSTGVHTHVRELRRHLEARHVTVTLVTPYSWGRALRYPVFGARLGIERVSAAASVAWYYHWHEVFLRRALRRRLAGMGPTTVYAQGPREARAAVRARRGPHQRVVMVVHYMTSQADEWVDKRALRRGGRVYRRIRRAEAGVIPGLDGVAFVSEAARRALHGWLPAARGAPSAVIPNFVEPSGDPGPADRLGDLVTVGALVEAKNHAYLLEVLAAARRLGRTYTLDVYGDGPDRAALARAAAAMGLDGQVRLRGFRPDVRRRLPGYRAYVHSSIREALPLAVIEAMAAGLPLVVADVGGIRDVCDEECGARFWPLDDPERAAAVLVDLLDDPGAVARASAGSAARFGDRFDASAVGPRLWAFLRGDPVPGARDRADRPGDHPAQAGYASASAVPASSQAASSGAMVAPRSTVRPAAARASRNSAALAPDDTAR